MDQPYVNRHSLPNHGKPIVERFTFRCVKLNEL